MGRRRRGRRRDGLQQEAAALFGRRWRRRRRRDERGNKVGRPPFVQPSSCSNPLWARASSFFSRSSCPAIGVLQSDQRLGFVDRFQRPKTVLPARASRPPPLTLPRPTAFLRRSTSDPPPASPSSVSSNGDRSLDTLNDSLCRAQSLFVACFSHADQSSSHDAPTLNLQADSFVTSSPSDKSANNSPPLVQTPPYDIPAGGGGGQDTSEALPDLSISSSETSASSWFEGPTYGSYDAEDDESDEDEFVLDLRRRSVDDL